MFGVLVPLLKGTTLLQPLIVVAYALMSLLFVAPAASSLWSSVPSSPSSGMVLTRIFAIVGYGWGIALAMLGSALITLNLVARTPRTLIPPAAFLAAVLALSLTSSFAVATVCALLAHRFSAGVAKSVIRACFLIILLLLALGSRVLPESWSIFVADHTNRRALTRLSWQASAFFVLAAAVAMIVLIRQAKTGSGATTESLITEHDSGENT